MTTELVQRRDELVAKRDTILLKSEIAVLESTLERHDQESRMIEGWGDVIDPLDSLRSEPDFFGTGLNGHRLRGDDHRQGDNAPFWRSEQELSFIQGMGEWIANTDTSTVGALKTLTGYVVHTGFTWKAKPEAKANSEAAAYVQTIIDGFFKRTNWLGNLDRELFRRTRKHGERFLRIKQGDDGKATAQAIEPSWITEPLNAREIEEHYRLPELDWKYGIATTIGNPNEVHGYFVVYFGNPQDYEFVPADEMSHVKANVDSNVKRGMSDFYPGEEWVKEAAKLLRNTIQGGSIQASIALIREWGTKTRGASIDSAAGGTVEFQTRLPAREGTEAPRSIPTERFYPGKVMDVKGAVYHPGPMGSSNAPTFLDIAQAGGRKAANTWCMPEFMYTGDASNANYSSTLVSESPFVRVCEDMQNVAATEDKSMLWRVVKMEVEADDDAQFTFEELQAAVDIDCEPPDVATRDREKDHRIRVEQHDKGILSLQTWAQEEGIDYENEQRNRQMEPKPLVANYADPKLAALTTAMESAVGKVEAKALMESMRGDS
jgi:hypothetical protein